jgi:hypothetical protein
MAWLVYHGCLWDPHGTVIDDERRWLGILIFFLEDVWFLFFVIFVLLLLLSFFFFVFYFVSRRESFRGVDSFCSLFIFFSFLQRQGLVCRK